MKRCALVMSGYMLTVLGTTHAVRKFKPQGAAVFAYAALPSVTILCLLLVVAKYLQEEKDEYLRMLTVRSLLWATAVLLAVSTFTDFVRSYGGAGSLPPFTAFVMFWMVFGLVQGVQSARSGAEADD